MTSHDGDASSQRQATLEAEPDASFASSTNCHQGTQLHSTEKQASEGLEKKVWSDCMLTKRLEAEMQEVNKEEEAEAGGHKESKEDEANGEEKDLDSGYAWCILLVMFLLQSSISGSSRIYGIVYAEEVAVGYYDREQASWPIATSSTVENLAGLLTPALANYLSWRQLELLSTLLFISANFLAYFSDSLTYDILALGIIQGLALSMCTVLSLAINNDYFERFRTSAYGISMSGSTFGVLYLTPLVSWLLDQYPGQFRLIYLALGLVFCSNIFLVMFIKPRRQRLCGGLRKQTGSDLKIAQSEQTGKQAITGGHFRRQTSIATSTNAEESKEPVSRKISMRLEEHFERKNSIASISYRTRSRRQSAWNRNTNTINRDLLPQPDRKESLKSHGTGSIIEGRMNTIGKSKSGLELTCDCNQSIDKMTTNINGSISAKQLAPQLTSDCGKSLTSNKFFCPIAHVDQQQQHDQCLKRTSTLVDCLQFRIDSDKLAKHEIVDLTQFEQSNDKDQPESSSFNFGIALELLKLPYLHCTWIMLAIYYLVARIYVIILVDFALDHGFSLHESTSLLNYWSFGELFGRIFLGSLIDLQFLSCRNCIVLTCLLLATTIGVMVAYESYLVYASCSVIVAALVSLEYMLINVLMVEYLGKHRVTSCYSLAAFISSAVLFARPTMIGLFRDRLGSYDGLLLTLASLAAIFAFLFAVLEPIFVVHWPRPASRPASRQQQQQQTTKTK